MKMGLCKRNISVTCVSKPSHPCLKNYTTFKTTAVVNGQTGQCLIEANVSDSRTLRFYVEATRLRNPNQEGSRGLGGNIEEHQRGKCMLKYVCHKKALYSISMDCGSVLVDHAGSLHNFTKRRAHWIAPPTYKDSVYFSSTIGIALDKLQMDISTSKIFAPEIEQKESEIETDSNSAKSVKKKEKKKRKSSKGSSNVTQSKDSK